jgi:UDP-2-acetamido-3-amino-2,3-dideoxy-glucuronate N-acetyltransferase
MNNPGTETFFVHESSYIDENVQIKEGTKIWHFSHVISGAQIGRNCNIGQNVCISGGVIIGNNVKIQNNVSVYEGTIVEDDVFLGPSCVLTNVLNPRSQIKRRDLYEKTLIKRGATICANATIVCNVTLGKYSFIAAGAVVTKDVPDYGFMVGVPAKLQGFMSRHGHRLMKPDKDGIYVCPESSLKYKKNHADRIYCLDLDEKEDLPEDLSLGKKSYREYK